jgi:tripartite-type tricarboxylate transporter receptor subunit TctC
MRFNLRVPLRTFCLSLLVFLTICDSHIAFAQSYPARPIKIIVPVAAGGGTDFSARLIAQKLTESWNIPVIVENRPGGGGNVGVEAAVKSDPDGYTLVMPITSFPVNPGMYPKLPFDSEKDLTPIVLVASAPLVLVLNPGVQATSVKELISLARANSGQLNYGNSGVGTTAHLAAELFKHSANLDIVNVPYKGGGPAIADLIAGNIQIYFSTIPAALSQTKSGRIKAIAQTGLKRVSEIPDVPTVAESGLPGFEVVGWFGLFAPAQTPSVIINKLNKELVSILQMKDVQEKLAGHGLIPGGGSPKELGKFLRTEIAKWKNLIQTAGIQTE